MRCLPFALHGDEESEDEEVIGGKSQFTETLSSYFLVTNSFFPTLKITTVSVACVWLSQHGHINVHKHTRDHVSQEECGQRSAVFPARLLANYWRWVCTSASCVSLCLPVDRPDQWERQVCVTSRVISLALTNYEPNQVIRTLTNQEECIFHPFILNSG